MTSEVPEQSSLPPERPPRRSGEGGAPVSGALTIVLAVVAVVAGFLILRAITGDDDGGGTAVPESPGTETTEAPDTSETTAPPTTEPAPTTTTEPPLVTAGAVVVVANANGIDGSAGAMTEQLAGAGFEMGTATNATTGQLETSVIYFDPSVEAAQAVAESVNRVLGGDSSISEVGTPAPVTDGELTGGVLLLLGNDKAGKTIEELSGGSDDAADAGDDGGTVTAPEPTGEDGTTGDDTTGDDTTGDGAQTDG